MYHDKSNSNKEVTFDDSCNVAIVPRKGENFDIVLRKFKKMCQNNSVLEDFKKKEFYEKPSDVRRRKKKISKSKMKKHMRMCDGD